MFGFSFPSKSIKELLHRTFGFVANKLKYKKTIAITLLTIISVWTVIVLTRMALANSRRLPFVHWGPREIDISCHYSNEEDSLQTTDENFRPPPKSIFFHETSCRKNLDPRQACAVESAARVHKEWQINVIFAAALDNETLNSGRLAALKKFTNVKFLRVHIEEYAKGTALESIVANSGLGSTYWPVSQTSDVLRFLSLYKYGGVYLDLDVIVSRPFDTLAKNWAAKEGADLIGSAAVAFSSDKMGKHMAETAINDMAEHFRGDLWTRNGPDVLTRILRTRCETNLTARMSAKTCKGFEVYDPSFFFPIHWIYTRAYFDPGKLSALTNYAYGYHMWNRLTEQYPIQEGSPYSRLAMKLCPTIFDMHKKEFGGPKKQ